jgi:small subunit ribosomal protein S10
MNQLCISVQSFDFFFLKKSILKIYKLSSFFSTIEIKTVPLPSTKTIYTVLRSPHIDKKSREQFEIKRYKIRLIIYFQETSSISFFLYILKNSTFSGVEIQILYKNLTYL